MDPAISGAALAALSTQEFAAALCGLAFLFLWRQSRIVYFGLWSTAWAVRAASAFVAFESLRADRAGWLALYAVLEFAFVILLVASARAGFASSFKEWRPVLRLILALPLVIGLALAFGRRAPTEALQISHALALGFVYAYNFAALRRNRGLGARIFRYALLVMAVLFLEHAGLVAGLSHAGFGAVWLPYMTYQTCLDAALNCVLAFAAMAMWSENQVERMGELNAEMDRVRRESARSLDLDRLTGLLNQTALARRVEEASGFTGVAAVCDMDSFKDINDRYGHLVGDEVLRSIGHLLRSSIRHGDEAFRWGGDEFVILFHGQPGAVAQRRMADIEARMKDFRQRGLGALPVSFSWGTADAAGRPLRAVLDEADRAMYSRKRARPPQTGHGARPAG